MLAAQKVPQSLPLQGVIESLESVILGKGTQIRLSLACVLARGHLLVEDVPGVGKTTLVKGLARVLGFENKRIQFTNDLLPADILGTAVFDAKDRQFHFQPGPIFTHIVIADELNRGTPRTQSAFLQAMEERRVTLDGVTRTLPDPFFVVGTQNPREQIGTYPLPESQLDRFLFRIHMGYPEEGSEFKLLKGERRQIEDLQPQLGRDDLLELQKSVDRIHSSDAIVHFVQRILLASRGLRGDFSGLSPRAGIAMLAAAKAWAFLAGRDFVIPDDVQETAPWVINHRMRFVSHAAFAKAKEFVLSIAVE